MSEAIAKVTGRAMYCGDLTVPGMVYARLLRSPYPHARIRRVEAARAEALPGVVAVVSGRDLAALDPYYGVAYRDQPVLAVDEVRYAGEPVVAVVAEDEAGAEEALALLSVDYDELPAALGVQEALAPGAPIVHAHVRPAEHYRDLRALHPEPERNICSRYEYVRGDVAVGFAQADHVFEDVFHFAPVYQYAMEPHICIADARRSGVTIWTASQTPFHVRKEIAGLFHLPVARVRVQVPYLGGGYGSKAFSKMEPLAAVLSLRVGRSVMVRLSVSEAMLTSSRHEATIRLKTGVRADGTLVAREGTLWTDTGAYADVGPRVTKKSGYGLPGPYRIPHVHVEAYAVYTHRAPAGAYRGYGGPQASWAYESQLDMIAERLGLDPVALRRKNLLERGEPFVPGDLPVDGDFRRGLTMALEALGTPNEGSGEGVGVACTMKGGGGTHTIANALVRLHADGSVTVCAAAVEIGQGLRTVLAKVAAEELGLPIDLVRVAPADTEGAPYDYGAGASRSTTLMGLAVQRAAADVKAQLRILAGRVLGVDPAEAAVKQGEIWGNNQVLSYAEVLRRSNGMDAGEVIGRGTYFPQVHENPIGGSINFWEIGAAAARVKVDEESGAVTVSGYASVVDVGKAINPLLCEGQEEGCVMQGLGHTLWEEMVFEDGQLLNPGLIDYHVPTMGDLPGAFRVDLMEDGNGPGPFGAKGMGESGINPVAPAVASAVAAATGVRLTELPLTPERVWRALRARQTR